MCYNHKDPYIDVVKVAKKKMLLFHRLPADDKCLRQRSTSVIFEISKYSANESLQSVSCNKKLLT